MNENLAGLCPRVEDYLSIFALPFFFRTLVSPHRVSQADDSIDHPGWHTARSFCAKRSLTAATTAERTAATTRLKNHTSVVWFTNLRAVLEMPCGPRRNMIHQMGREEQGKTLRVDGVPTTNTFHVGADRTRARQRLRGLYWASRTVWQPPQV